jgi:hypothetical protein
MLLAINLLLIPSSTNLNLIWDLIFFSWWK